MCYVQFHANKPFRLVRMRICAGAGKNLVPPPNMGCKARSVCLVRGPCRPLSALVGGGRAVAMCGCMHPRLRSDIRVQAILRMAAAAGAFAAVLRHGHDVAGMIFVKMSYPDRRADIYTAAPGAGDLSAGVPGAGSAAQAGPRWICTTAHGPISDVEAQAYLARQAASDPDIWAIEIETRDRTPILDGSVEPAPGLPRDPSVDAVFRR